MPDAESYAKRLVKGSTIVFMALVASGFVAFLIRVFLARSMSVADYGLFYAIFAIVSFFALFRDLGLNSALVKYIPEFLVHKDHRAVKSAIIFSTLFQAGFAFLITVALFVFSNRLAMVLFKSEAAILPLQILSVWFFVMVFYYIIRSTFQGLQNMPAYAAMDFCWLLLVFLSAVLFVKVFNLDVEGVAFAYLTATIVTTAFNLLYLRWRYCEIFNKKTQISRSLAKRLFAFALPVFIGSLGGLILGYTDIIMITAFRSLSEVGYYQTVQPIMQILWTFVTSLTTVFFPMTSELWAKRRGRFLNELLYFLVKFSFILILPAALLFMAFPDTIIGLIFGSNYLAGATALQILSGATVLYTLFAILACAISGIGRPTINTEIVGVMALLNFFGNLLLIPVYGINGAAAATFLSYLLGLILMLYYAQKIIKFTVPGFSLFKIFVGGMITAFFIYVLKLILPLPLWPKTFAIVLLSLLFYGAWILGVKAVKRSDLEILAQILPVPKWLHKIARE